MFSKRALRKLFNNVHFVQALGRCYMRQFFLQLATQWWQEHCQTRCRSRVTRCSRSRSVAKSRKLVNFSCSSQRNFSVRHMLRRGCYTRNFVRNLSCNGVALQVAEKFALCNSAFRPGQTESQVSASLEMPTCVRRLAMVNKRSRK